MLSSGVGAEGATRPGRHFRRGGKRKKRGGKKEGKRKKKGRKRKKEGKRAAKRKKSKEKSRKKKEKRAEKKLLCHYGFPTPASCHSVRCPYECVFLGVSSLSTASLLLAVSACKSSTQNKIQAYLRSTVSQTRRTNNRKTSG